MSSDRGMCKKSKEDASQRCKLVRERCLSDSSSSWRWLRVECIVFCFLSKVVWWCFRSDSLIVKWEHRPGSNFYFSGFKTFYLPILKNCAFQWLKSFEQQQQQMALWLNCILQPAGHCGPACSLLWISLSSHPASSFTNMQVLFLPCQPDRRADGRGRHGLRCQ